MTDDSETIALRATVIGGHRYADDYQVIGSGASLLCRNGSRFVLESAFCCLVFWMPVSNPAP
jgi:hypothetical protein